MITEAELAELERLEKAATPGPWNVGWECKLPSIGIYDSTGTQLVRVGLVRQDWETDHKLISLSRNSLPSLLLTIRELQKRVKELEDRIENMDDAHLEDMRAASERESAYGD